MKLKTKYIIFYSLEGKKSGKSFDKTGKSIYNEMDRFQDVLLYACL